MGEVKDIAGQYDAMPIAHLARAFRMARETVAKLLREGGIKPSGKRKGYDVYRLMDAAPVICGHVHGAPEAGPGQDPSTMRPSDLRAYYQALNEKDAWEQGQGLLIPRGEVHHQYAAIAKIVTRHWRALPDVVERDTRCGPEIVVYLKNHADEVLNEIADMIESEEGADDAVGIRA